MNLLTQIKFTLNSGDKKKMDINYAKYDFIFYNNGKFTFTINDEIKYDKPLKFTDFSL